MAFLNSSFISQNEFSAIVYDLTMQSFQANITIFGYENVNNINSYRPIKG